jgi:F-type H+-transporting ATPase subunit c
MSMLKSAYAKFSLTLGGLMMLPMTAFAAEAADNQFTENAARAMAAAFCISVAAFAGALGQAKAAAAALEGIARNPGARGEVFVPFILGLALIESLVIYALLIAFQIKPA